MPVGSNLLWAVQLFHIDERNAGSEHSHPFLQQPQQSNLQITAPPPEVCLDIGHHINIIISINMSL